MSDAKETTAGAPDLDAWRAEAGACAPLDAAATRGPWRSTWVDDEAADAERGKRGEEVTIEAVGLEGLARIVLGVTWYDGPHPCCREEDAAFIAAARTGWPRDAARVGVLCVLLAAAEARIATLEAAAAPTRGSLSVAYNSACARRVEAEEALRRAPMGKRGEEAQRKLADALADEAAKRATLDAYDREHGEPGRVQRDAADAEPCPGSRGW